MPRGVIIVANETWKLSAVTNRQTRAKLCRELDKIDKILATEVAVHVPKSLLDRLEFSLGEFGDLLLDTDIRYAEVM
jgi:hypothetical protein